MEQETYTAFAGEQRLASGPLGVIAVAVKHAHADRVLIFSDRTGRETDVDTRGDEGEIMARYAPPPPAKGRPKLGVVSREITLLPRHWDWLSRQRGGASGTLRRLVDQAVSTTGERTRASADAAYKFMSAIAGDLPGFEEAARALFAADADKFAAQTKDWPGDIRTHAHMLAKDALV
ncbi:DUF2239 family protein [Pacificimonas sp. WHA3]|uniref:DUF2239 family protein n=1 Tax=Pacificimonas pallii TaxID=2827236 RepID=A0ABS6SGD0_9SPHN|nr:DUF2239 family protein [Pacificimonas pallii]MBV7257464.1 DUF2239 family protein [Pacificimonas pallii]